ncbi:hypothetical protein [Streptomyces sp. NPDC059863]|uniref:hypothetical protein n=1 Tax=unclassified Streptomyces TaxID=2593676 RepID=UPI0036468A21
MDCGGYDTCVTDRVKKLREESARAVAEATKKAAESNADPLYQKARADCGGYDTCVTDRVKKLRDQAAQKERNAKAIAEATKKAAESNADPLYQQARAECGGYDTCVTDRVAKLRAQKKATTAKTTTGTGTGQHKQPQKKTQTPDYRGKGGVKASAA